MLTDADTLLATRFAAIRDETDDSDWNDVLRRRAPRRRSNVRALVAVAVAIAVGIPTALAFGAVRDFFFGTPAPPLIKSAFAGDNQMRALMLKWARTHHQKLTATPPVVNGAKAHGVMAVSTSDGPLALWAAPAAGGRQCWFVDFENDLIGHRRATGGGACDSSPTPPSKIDVGWGWSAEHPTLKVLSGRLYVKAVSLDVTATDNKTRVTKTYRVPVVHGYFLGAFPRSLHSPKRVVARNAAGRIVLTFRMPR
jgi:hypothetical protein